MASGSGRGHKSTPPKEFEFSRRKLGFFKYFVTCRPRPKMTPQFNFTVSVSDSDQQAAVGHFLGACRALGQETGAEATASTSKKGGDKSSSVNDKGKGKATTPKQSPTHSGDSSDPRGSQLSIRTNARSSTQDPPQQALPAQPAWDDNIFPWATYEDMMKSSSAALGCFVVGNGRFRGNIADLPIPDQAVQPVLAVQFRVVDNTANARDDQNQPEFMVFCPGYRLADVVKSLAPEGSGKSALVHRADGRGESTTDATGFMSNGRKFWVEIVENMDGALNSA